MPFNPTPNVDCKYGAPMGRMAHRTFTDKQGRTFELTVTADAAPMRLVYVPLIDGGCYDRGGAYWGSGAPLLATSAVMCARNLTAPPPINLAAVWPNMPSEKFTHTPGSIAKPAGLRRKS